MVVKVKVDAGLEWVPECWCVVSATKWFVLRRKVEEGGGRLEKIASSSQLSTYLVGRHEAASASGKTPASSQLVAASFSGHRPHSRWSVRRASATDEQVVSHGHRT